MFRIAPHKKLKLKLLDLLRPLMVTGMISLSASVVHAATYTYTGNANYGLDSNGACAAGLGGPGADSANWFDARNWGSPCAPTSVPGAGDDANIGDFTVIINGNATVHSLTFSPTPPTDGSLGNALDVGNNGTLTITGAFTWTAGVLGYPAGHSLNGSGTIHVLQGGQWIISGAADKGFFESSDSVINDGDATWSGGNIHLYQSGSNGITNNGTFTATTDASLIEDTAIGLDPIGFVNNGTFRKTGGGGITNVTWAFTNHGLVDAQLGSIALAGGIENGGMSGYAHIHDGTFNAAAGATVDFAGNTHVVGDAARFTGAGRVRLTGGILQTAGNAQIGTPTAPGNFEIAGGGFNPGSNSGGQGITPTGSLVCSSGSTLYLTGGNIGGPINVQAGGTANWTGGELDGIWNIAQGATLNISGTGTRTLQGYGLGNYGNQNLPGILNNAGTVNWSGTCNLDVQYGDPGTETRGVINNSGLFIAQNNQDFTGNGLFKNLSAGVFRKASGTLTRFAPDGNGFVVKDSGLFDVLAGDVSLDKSTHVLGTGATFSGSGRTRLVGGTIVASGTYTLASGSTFELAGGGLTGPGGTTAAPAATFNGPGTFVWSGGEIDGVVNIGATATLNISGTSDKTLNGYGKSNYGNVNQPGILNNAGTAIWTGTGAIQTSYGGPLKNNGTFNVQTTAPFSASLTNTGTLNLGTPTVPGVLKVSGDYTQTATGVLNLKIGGRTAGTQFDQVQVGGIATFGGTLNAIPINGFTPATTDRLAVILYPTHKGTFATLNGPFRADYEDPNLYLSLNPVAPRITSFTPASGIIGSTIAISGTNLSGATVFFNGVRATVNTAQSSATRLVVTVPSGATTGPIRVATSNGSFTTATKFTVTQLVRYTISGSITSGTAPIPGVSGPVPNVPVFLLNRTNLPALGAVLSNPALLASSAALISRTTTNAAGQYSFSAMPGSYYIVPAQPGVFFTTAFRAVAVSNAAVPNQNFVGAGVDNTAPTVTISTATATAASGKASDGTTGSGILTVVVTLQNSSNQYLNWTATSSTPQFTANAVVGSYKIANVAGGTTPMLNLNKISSQSWAVTLPAKLPTGSYRLTVRAIDRAFRVSLPATQVIVVKAAADVAVVAAASSVHLSSATLNVSQSSVSLRFNGGLEAQSASDAAHYTVAVNGNPVTVESAGYDAANHTVTLSLPEGRLHSGDKVVVSWQGLLDERGGTLDSQTSALSAR